MELQEGKNAEAVQERFYNTLYDALCKNQEGYNLIWLIIKRNHNIGRKYT